MDVDGCGDCDQIGAGFDFSDMPPGTGTPPWINQSAWIYFNIIIGYVDHERA
jgi:hypothetical protein